VVESEFLEDLLRLLVILVDVVLEVFCDIVGVVTQGFEGILTGVVHLCIGSLLQRGGDVLDTLFLKLFVALQYLVLVPLSHAVEPS